MAAVAAKETLLALQLSCRGDSARECILRDWIKFVESRKEVSLLRSLPKLPSGGAIDWLKLYEEVVARGGFAIVSQRRQWSDVLGPNGLNIKGLMPYQLAAHYDRYLRAFEEKQLFGRDAPVSETTMSVLPSKRGAEEEDDAAPVATMQDLQDAQGGMGGTPLPRVNKRFKAQRELQTHLGTLHNIVLALDSNLPEQELSALNLLTVLSYGDGMEEQHQVTGGTSVNTTALENTLMVDNVPGLLDALYRQIIACKVLPQFNDWHSPKVRRQLLNLKIDDGERELLDSKALLVLNIVRNLAIISANEKPLATNEEWCVFLIVMLRCVNNQGFRNGYRRASVEIGDHVLDTLCAISRRIDFLALHPPASLEVWHPQYQLSTQLWHHEQIFPLECLLRELCRILVNRPLQQQRRSILLRACEVLTNVCRDVALKSFLASSKALKDPALLDQMVALLGCSRQDFLPRKSRSKRQERDSNEAHEDNNYADSDSDNTTDGDDNSRWPAPWENDGLPSGVGFGVVYVSPEGVRHTTSSPHINGARAAHAMAFDEELDHEMRDAALEVLFRLSDYDDAMKLRMAQHSTCLRRLAGSLLSCIGRPEAARIIVATLSNLSMNRATFPFFLAIEKDLILVACSDVSVSDILNNVVADVYGMHSL